MGAGETVVGKAGIGPRLELRDISKRFGPVLANDVISLSVQPGEILAVLGENGAGKTTLLNILSGIYQPDAGTILLDGQPTTIASPADAIRQGIGTVYQHFTLVPNLSVTENILLGTETGFRLDLAAAEQRAQRLLAEVRLDISPRTEIRHLSLGQRQRVEIVKTLARGSRILLLDEPTSVLSPAEIDGLFAILRRLRAEGVAIVLITHKLDEALAISDRITILRGGRNAGDVEAGSRGGETARSDEELTQQIIEMMFGGERREGERHVVSSVPRSLFPVPPVHPASSPPRLPALTLRDLTARGDRGETALRGLTLELMAGEVFGIAGVDGNGQKELGEVIAGQRPVIGGEIVLGGETITNRGVAAALAAGIGYVTDDRLGEGTVPGLSVAENAVLKLATRQPFSRGWRNIWLNRAAIDAEAQRMIAAFNVRTPSTSTPVTRLSGGNIQKLLLARELALEPTLIVCANPTAGLDLQTTRVVLDTLRVQADVGKTVLLISSELDDLLAICDRIGVIRDGRIVAILPRAEADSERLGRLMVQRGGEDSPPGPPIMGGDDELIPSAVHPESESFRSPPIIGGPGGPSS